MGYFSNIYKAELPHRAKTVYMYLKDRSNAQGQCYPAIGTIAKELHLSRRTVERAIQDLITAGLLKKEQRWRENGGRSSLLFTLTDCNKKYRHQGEHLSSWWRMDYVTAAYPEGIT